MRQLTSIIFFFSFAASIHASPLTTISGSVSNFDGSPVKVGNVVLTDLTGVIDNPIASFTLTQDGRFQFPLYNGGFYKLWFCAPNHKAFGVPIILDSLRDKNIPLELNVRLATLNYKETFDEVKIIGDWNKFDFESAQPMKKQSSGVYTYEVKGNRAAYQLIGLTLTTQSVNGTMSDDFIYDGGGDYQSIVSKEDNSPLVIEFNPSLIVRSKNTDLPKATFNARYSFLEQFSILENEYQEQVKQAMNSFEDWVDKEKPASIYIHNYGEFPEKLLKEAQNQRLPESVRQILVVQLLSLPFYSTNNSGKIISVAERLLGVKYPMWSLYNDAIINYAKLKGKDREKVLRRFAAQSPDRNIQLQCIAELALFAKTQGDKEKIREIYKNALKEVAAFKEAELLLMEIDPNKPTVEGNPIPDFQLTTVNGKKISKENLKGKYVLLDFWMSWFQPTLREREFISKANKRFKKNNFEIISISLDDKLSDLKNYLDKHPEVNWTQCFEEKRFESPIAKNFDIRTVPFPILISPEGKVLALGVSLRQYRLSETLSTYLK